MIKGGCCMSLEQEIKVLSCAINNISNQLQQLQTVSNINCLTNGNNYLNDSKDLDVLFTVEEVSKLLKTNPPYVYKIIKMGLLPVLKLGRYKVRKIALDEFLRKYEGKDLSDLNNIKDII